MAMFNLFSAIDTNLTLLKLNKSKKDLLSRHRARNPLANEIQQLIESYNDLAARAPRNATRTYLHIADLYVALGELQPALTLLARASEDGGFAVAQKASVRAAKVYSILKSKRITRNKVNLKDGFFSSISAHFLSTTIDPYTRNRIELFSSSHQGDPKRSLILAEQNLKLRPGAATRDFLLLVRNILLRRNHEVYLEDIGAIIERQKELLDRNGARAFLLGLSIRFRNNPSHLQALRLEEASLDTIGKFISDANFDDLLSLTKDKGLFLYTGDDVETMKLAVVTALGSLLFSERKAEGFKVVTYLDKASNTRRFWDDDEWRQHSLDSIERLEFEPGDYGGAYAKAVVRFLNGDFRRSAAILRVER